MLSRKRPRPSDQTYHPASSFSALLGGGLQGGYQSSVQKEIPPMARDCEGFSRRDFIKVGSAGLLGMTLPQLLKFESQAKASPAETRRTSRATSVIMVWLAGGPATIDMWDLRP